MNATKTHCPTPASDIFECWGIYAEYFLNDHLYMSSADFVTVSTEELAQAVIASLDSRNMQPPSISRKMKQDWMLVRKYDKTENIQNTLNDALQFMDDLLRDNL